MSDPRRPYFFLHVMKTGGSTFQRRVMVNFPRTEVFPTVEAGYDPQVYKGNVPAMRALGDDLHRFAFFTVHVPFWFAEELDLGFTMMTVLREPVARAVSHLEQSARQLGMASAEEVWRHPFLGAVVTDYQLKQLAQDEVDMPPVAAQQAFVRGEEMVDGMGTPREVDEAGYARAVARLERMDAVGFTDDLERFLAAVADRYGWRIADLEDQNVAEASTVSSALRDEISDALAMDRRFYEHARSRRDPRRGGSWFPPTDPVAPRGGQQ